MVEGPDAVLLGVFPFRQVRSQDAIIHDVDERSDTVPAFIIEPDLRRGGRLIKVLQNLQVQLLFSYDKL